MRDLGTSITIIYSFLVIFVVVKTGPLLFVSYGVAFTFSIYALVVLSGSIGLYFIMPETKDSTLQEIEDTMTSRS